MSLPLVPLGRPLAAVGAALFAAAVLLGRAAPVGHTASVDPDRRSPAPVRHLAVGGYSAPGLGRGLHLLDLEDGSLAPVRLPGTHEVTYAACSPWRDGRGRTHLTGQWRDHDAGGRAEAIGLVRYALPGLEVLDRVEIDVCPSGAPCWAPGTAARVLFAGSDYRLHSLSFDDPGGPPHATALRWRVQPPGAGVLAVADPAWPSDPRLGGRVIASLSYTTAGGPARGLTPWRLWWLELDPGGTAIVGAGPLIDPGREDGETEAHERLASIAAAPGGGLVLAYLAQPRGQAEYQLRLGAVAIDETTGAPRVVGASTAAVAEVRAPTPPGFSGDGRWVYSFPRAGGRRDRAERHSVMGALAERAAPIAMSRRPADPRR